MTSLKHLLIAWITAAATATATAASVGCGGGPANTPDAGREDAGADSGSGLPDGPGITGVLRSEAGEPQADVQILACMAVVCLFGDTDGDGRFVFEIEPRAEIALKTPEHLNQNPRQGAALYPVVVTDDQLIDMGSVFVPNLPAGTVFGPPANDPQTLAAGDGLELTLNRADLTPRVGDVLVDLAARRIPDDRIPPLSELADEEVVAVYAIHPFGAVSSSPIGVSVPSDLPAGTAVKFRAISEIDGLMSEPAAGTATGTAVVTDAGAGLSELSWLVVSR